MSIGNLQCMFILLTSHLCIPFQNRSLRLFSFLVKWEVKLLTLSGVGGRWFKRIRYEIVGYDNGIEWARLR